MPHHDDKYELQSRLVDAISDQDIVALRQCFKEGADPNFKRPNSRLIPLFQAALYPDCIGVVRELLQHGARYDSSRDSDISFLHFVASCARPGNKYQQILDEILKLDVKAGHFWTLQITTGEHKGKTPVDVLTKSMREYYEITPEDIARGKDPKTRKTLLPQEKNQKNIIWDFITAFWHHPKSDACATELRTVRQQTFSSPTLNPTSTTEKIKAH